MKSHLCGFVAVAFAVANIGAWSCFAEATGATERRDSDAGTGFAFQKVPAPAKNDAAATAVFTVIDGTVDSNSAGTKALNDGRLPEDEDSPQANFFFAAGTDGGRLALDLQKVIQVKRVNTYSWHANTRGPQVYALYGADGRAEGFDPAPKRPTDPSRSGWKLVCRIDTRPKTGGMGGQYGASVFDPEGNLGSFRYLLFDISPTEREDPFGNTFFSEIDVIDADASEAPQPIAGVASKTELFKTSDGAFELVLDVSETPDLSEWAHKEIVPLFQEWYPKLAQLLASENYTPPVRVTVRFSPSIRGVAATSGTRIGCAAAWFRANLKGEAKGAVFHEFVHVIQQYGRSRNRSPVPGWLTEGMADYIRWFLFEPESHGAEITARNISRARYDASYRITGNFLDWTTTKYNKELVPKLNAAIRQGRYEPALWKELTGYGVEELGAQWRSAMEQRVAGEPKDPR